MVVLDEVPKLLSEVKRKGEIFAAAGWQGAGLMRACPGSAEKALERGVIVVPAGMENELISATPALVISDEEIERALELLERC